MGISWIWAACCALNTLLLPLQLLVVPRGRSPLCLRWTRSRHRTGEYAIKNVFSRWPQSSSLPRLPLRLNSASELWPVRISLLLPARIRMNAAALTRWRGPLISEMSTLENSNIFPWTCATQHAAHAWGKFQAGSQTSGSWLSCSGTWACYFYKNRPLQCWHSLLLLLKRKNKCCSSDLHQNNVLCV